MNITTARFYTVDDERHAVVTARFTEKELRELTVSASVALDKMDVEWKSYRTLRDFIDKCGAFLAVMREG